jgi:hypothetical protein
MPPRYRSRPSQASSSPVRGPRCWHPATSLLRSGPCFEELAGSNPSSLISPRRPVPPAASPSAGTRRLSRSELGPDCSWQTPWQSSGTAACSWSATPLLPHTLPLQTFPPPWNSSTPSTEACTAWPSAPGSPTTTSRPSGALATAPEPASRLWRSHVFGSCVVAQAVISAISASLSPAGPPPAPLPAPEAHLWLMATHPLSLPSTWAPGA